jgi:uncharacterized membrane protein YadS
VTPLAFWTVVLACGLLAALAFNPARQTPIQRLALGAVAVACIFGAVLTGAPHHHESFDRRETVHVH